MVIIRRSQSFGLQTSCCDWSLCCQPDAIVVDIDGDGNFIMNVQKLATIHVENLPVKILILNNQHLGMVMQWEDRFYKANRAHTYLGEPAKGKEIFPKMLQFAAACGIPAARVTKKSNLREAIQKCWIHQDHSCWMWFVRTKNMCCRWSRVAALSMS